ncbi:putative sulfite oxidase [Cocos nucifera]|nr:putative sulfite oxidase [Cocos nucifera]
MAASVDNRQFGHLNPGSGIGSPVEAVPKNFQNTHRSDSPVRGCSFPPLLPLPFAGDRHGRDKAYHNSDEEEEEEEGTDWKIAYGVASSHLEVEPSIRDPRDEGTSDSWVERNPSLIRLTGKHPFNCEPPLTRLMHHGFITPVPLHYVRNHGAVPRADWDTWTIDITGLVRLPTRLTMDELVRDFAPLEIPVTLVCAGNRRKEQNMVRQSVGFNWGPGAISTSVWRGARLRDVLRRCGVMGRKDGAFHVCFEGAEDLPGGGSSKYGTSLRREVAMDPSRGVMLAYMQNGELLGPDHGFPVRVIIPGFIGGRMVKWLKRIIVTPQESDSYYHYRDNRVLPSHVDAEIASAEAWWYKPEYIINELNINSVITVPGHDEILPINSLTTQRPYTMKGYAYSGGGKKVTRVEITLDGGETWLVCRLEHPEKPNKYGKYWCWCFWSVEVEVLDLLGAKEVAVRAWDETLNTQPEKLIWNVMGMMNNCWFRVKVNVCRPHKGEIGLMFEHPTQPGNQSGGWMARQKHLETTEGGQSLKKSISTPFMNTSEKQYTMSEVRKHSSQDSAWIVVHGHVYDCTGFIKDHPGGADSILINAGTDCTEEFDAIHSDKAKAMIDTYRIGELIVTGYSSDNSGENPKFPNGGLMSQHLESLPMGSILDVKGPLGHIEYSGRGSFLINGKPRFARRLAMIAGGTGITPVYQVIQAVLRDQPEDRTEMHLVYANRTEDDILLRDELDGWAREHPDQLKVWYVVGEVKRNEQWRYSTGFVTESILREHIPLGASDDTLALACGPPPMIQFAVLPNLEKMNYDISSSCLLF